MMSILHLIWIIPVCVTMGMILAALLWVNGGSK